MGFSQAFKMAIKSILGNKVRSLLTMLGVIIGVGAVIAAVAFAQGSTKNITDRVKSLGTNLLQISITGRNSNRNLSYEDLMEFSLEHMETIEAVAPQVSGSATVKFGDKSTDSSMNGTNSDYETIKDIHVQEGRFITAFDVDSMQRVAVVGTAVSKELFPIQNPMNQKIKINGQIFTVVGILQEKAGSQDGSDDDQVIIPVSVAQRLTRNAIIRNFSIKVSDPKYTDQVMNDLNTFLFGIYRSSSTYRVTNQEQLLSTLGDITGSLMIILGGIATISLVVGGIGIMNIMLVSVTERTKEIGIRKAIGAKRSNIMVQFLIEAIMVTGLGGIVGILLGVGIIKFIIGGFKIVPEVYSLTWMMISFGISLSVGIIFGLFPAYKASKLNPIIALRFE